MTYRMRAARGASAQPGTPAVRTAVLHCRGWTWPHARNRHRTQVRLGAAESARQLTHFSVVQIAACRRISQRLKVLVKSVLARLVPQFVEMLTEPSEHFFGKHGRSLKVGRIGGESGCNLPLEIIRPILRGFE